MPSGAQLSGWQAVEVIRRAGRPTSILIITAIVLTIVALSPYALEVAALPGMDWARLSDVGQTYGAASALLSVVALIAVALSVRLQAKEALAGHRHAARTFHHELLRMAMEDPLYMQCWGTGEAGLTYDEQRKYFYINLIIAYVEMRWDVGDLTDSEVRLTAANQWFTSEAFRLFWEARGGEWAAIARTRSHSRSSKFVRIIDDEYRKTVVAGQPAHHVVASGVMRAPCVRIGVIGLAVGTVVGGVIAARLRNRWCADL